MALQYLGFFSLTIGMVFDIWTERGNDSEDYDPGIRAAGQEDFDRF